VDLWSLACWDCRFESRRRHDRLSLVNVVLSGRGLADGTIPHQDRSYWVWVCVCVSLSVIRCNNNPIGSKRSQLGTRTFHNLPPYFIMNSVIIPQIWRRTLFLSFSQLYQYLTSISFKPFSRLPLPTIRARACMCVCVCACVRACEIHRR
jgi:hypothetical protein